MERAAKSKISFLRSSPSEAASSVLRLMPLRMKSAAANAALTALLWDIRTGPPGYDRPTLDL